MDVHLDPPAPRGVGLFFTCRVFFGCPDTRLRPLSSSLCSNCFISPRSRPCPWKCLRHEEGLADVQSRRRPGALIMGCAHQRNRGFPSCCHQDSYALQQISFIRLCSHATAHRLDEGRCSGSPLLCDAGVVDVGCCSPASHIQDTVNMGICVPQLLHPLPEEGPASRGPALAM